MSQNKVDLEALVEDWAWTYFRQKASKKEKKLMENELLSMETDWKRVKFIHDEPKYEPEPPKPGSGKPINDILFSSNFTNKTDREQRYTFRTERSTRSTCSVQIEQAYTLGVDMEIKLTCPGSILEANAGFHRELTLTNSEGQTIEEELSWGVDSEIQVRAKHQAQANLIILEEEYTGKFIMRTKIKGRVRVVFYNIKDNNSFLRAAEGDVYEIVREAIKAGRITGDAVVADGDSKSVVCTTRGKCRFRYGLKQNVEVDQVPL